MNPDKGLLKEAAAEIKQLRQANNHMAARLQVFDDMMLLFRSRPDFGTCGMSEDLAYLLEKRIAVIEEEEKRHDIPEEPITRPKFHPNHP